mmetsp:Transcript_15730/g.17099  ORF Transcript_15730/g.17099 Transcript_15730/m.17099 type:complete len:92 (+) Transcript_15730:263-538(+)
MTGMYSPMVFVEGVEKPLSVQEFSRISVFHDQRPSISEVSTSVSATPDLLPMEYYDEVSIELLSLLFSLSNDVELNSYGNPFHVDEHALFD